MHKIYKLNTLLSGEKEVAIFRIYSISGAYVEVTNLGASIISVVVPDKKGRYDNVVLKYDTLEGYLTDKFYLGSTIGRYANRISNGCFSMDNTLYTLDKNDGNNSNHGGFHGFNKKVFNYSILYDKIVFYIESSDGEGGFPGNLQFRVSYSFSPDNELLIEYEAGSDKRTPVNFTNHTYFNLSSGNSILDHELKINALEYLESNEEFLPAGNIKNVKNTAFGFFDYKYIGKMSTLKKDMLKGYNTYFIKKTGEYVASLKEEVSGRVLDVYTSMPGIMLYTGDYLSHPFVPFEGICLEAHYYPDGVNHKDFISNILEPGVSKYDFIRFHFHI